VNGIPVTQALCLKTFMSPLEILLLDHNQLTGSTGAICDAIELKYFVSDCAKRQLDGEEQGEEAEKITCDCCNLCCHASNSTCNMYDWNVNLDPAWEYGYTRFVYVFSQNVIPTVDPGGNEGEGNNPV
jgi:hypothetical protein